MELLKDSSTNSFCSIKKFTIRLNPFDVSIYTNKSRLMSKAVIGAFIFHKKL